MSVTNLHVWPVSSCSSFKCQHRQCGSERSSNVYIKTFTILLGDNTNYRLFNSWYVPVKQFGGSQNSWQKGQHAQSRCSATPFLPALHPKLASFGLVQNARLDCAHSLSLGLQTRPQAQLTCTRYFTQYLSWKDNLQLENCCCRTAKM